jgi:hypothetical protein
MSWCDSSLAGWGTMLQARRPQVWFPIRSLDFSIDPILPSSHTGALGSTQPLTEMSTKNLPGGCGRHIRLTTFLPSVNCLSTKMWEPRCLTIYGGLQSVTGAALPFTFKHKDHPCLDHMGNDGECCSVPLGTMWWTADHQESSLSQQLFFTMFSEFSQDFIMFKPGQYEA